MTARLRLRRAVLVAVTAALASVLPAPVIRASPPVGRASFDDFTRAQATQDATLEQGIELEEGVALRADRPA